MPFGKKTDLEETSRSLHEAKNMLRAIEGKPPEPYVPKALEYPYCSFCGKGRSEVATLVEGPSVFICDECVKKAQEIVQENMPALRSGGESG
jgi:hypothetical protein